MTLLDSLTACPPPLAADEDGVMRVGGTRVRLDTVIGAFNEGSAPEEILFRYPSLKLDDIYSVVTYYLWHRADVDAYLAHELKLADEVRKEAEARFPTKGIRERLLARRGAKP